MSDPTWFGSFRGLYETAISKLHHYWHYNKSCVNFFCEEIPSFLPILRLVVAQAVEVGHLSPQPQHQMRILLAQIIKGPKITIYEFLQHQPRIAS